MVDCAELEGCSRGPRPLVNLFEDLLLEAKALFRSKLRDPEAGRALKVGAVASACLPVFSVVLSPSPQSSEVSTSSENSVREERGEETEEDRVDCEDAW